MSSPPYKIRKAQQNDLKGMMLILEMANFHHIPSPEMPELEIDKFFVAEIVAHETLDMDTQRIVGLSGYKITPDGQGKTTLMAVDPVMRGGGVGTALQIVRLEAMYALGANKVTTNADLPQTIAWYKKHFNYYEVGSLAKEHVFGNPEIDHWTTLKMDLKGWVEAREKKKDICKTS